jgi:hypothetical protein
MNVFIISLKIKFQVLVLKLIFIQNDIIKF